MIIFHLLIALLCFYILAIVCDRYFVKTLQIIGNKLKLSDDVVGASIMAVGSSSPELFTALIATFTVGAEDIGAGTIVGSAIFNILVIVGGAAYVAKAYLKWQPVMRDLLFYVLTVLVLYFTFRDGQITMSETLLYLGLYATYIFLLSQWGKIAKSAQQNTETLDTISEETEKIEERIEEKKGVRILLKYIDRAIDRVYPDLEKRPHLYMLTFFISIAIIITCSWLLVDSAVAIAEILSIPQSIVALTILAAGMSLPDLLSSLIVAKQGRGDMAISNPIGSNIFDILFGLGFSWFLFTAIHGEALYVSTENLNSSIILLFATCVVMLAIFILSKFAIGKRIGIFLISLYVIYLVYSISHLL